MASSNGPSAATISGARSIGSVLVTDLVMVWNPVSKRNLSVSVRAPTPPLAEPLGDGIGKPDEFPAKLGHLVLVRLERLLVPDRLRLALGFDGAVVPPVGELDEMFGLRSPQRGDQGRAVDDNQVGDPADADRTQLVHGDRPDTPQPFDRQRVQERLDRLRIDHDDTRTGLDSLGRRDRFRLDRGEFGQELVRRHPDRTGQRQLGSNVVANPRRDPRTGTEEPARTGDVEERLVQRERLHEWRVAVEDRPDLAAHVAVQRVIARQEHRVRAAALGHDRRHRGVHAEATSLVRRRGHHAAASGPTHHHGLADEIGSTSQFDRHEERIHVDMEDLAPAHHVDSLAGSTP